MQFISPASSAPTNFLVVYNGDCAHSPCGFLAKNVNVNTVSPSMNKFSPLVLSYPPHSITESIGLTKDIQFIAFALFRTCLNSNNSSSNLSANCKAPTLLLPVNTLTGSFTKLPSSTVRLGTFISIVGATKSYSTASSIK